ncbi:MAG: trimethylamine methyltransferase family protein [Chloroflexi bacterium]|nr:trimethylamine methyltransferase family protein [Chloroflexota bacterium]MBU1661607.1 trimethylamine methyltransferase family protein [Chloroflexota bacterium]
MTKKITAPSKGLIGGQYKPLTDKQVKQIHAASLAILARTGVQVEEPDALRLFREAGADVDGNRVRLSQPLVEDALDKAPSRIVLAGRDPKDDLILEGARVHIGTGGAALQVLDLETGKIRAAVLEDVADMARIVDALDNIHFYLIPIYPANISKENVEVSKYYASLANTTKHVQAGAYTLQGIRDVVEMCEKIMGGAEQLRERPIVSFITSWMVSPLKFDSGVTTLLLEVCRQLMPVVLSAAPMAGSTAPVTLAGMLAQLNAEQLAGLALTQLAQPGCPVLIGPIPATANLRSGRYLGGSIELGLCNAAITQMAHFYQVPIYNSAGMTESKLPDIQAGIEKTQSVIQVALAGSNFIHHAAGMLEDMSTIAYEQFVIDNEVLGMAMRAVRGIEVNAETLALDAIDRVGPGNHYLMDEHTLRYMRTEHYFPSEVINRQGRYDWEADGATDARFRAQEIARRILAEHKPTPIDPDVVAWIKERFASSLVLGNSEK